MSLHTLGGRPGRARVIWLAQSSLVLAVTALAACAPGAAPAAPTTPTIGAAATQVVAGASPAAATAVAGASPAAATIQAGASPAATQVAAAASPVATQAAAAASPVATQVAAAASPIATQAAAAAPAVATQVTAASPVRFAGVNLSPTDTTITVQNAGTSAVDMSGWQLRVGDATATMPPNTSAAPGDTITIHTASGTSSGRDVYLGAQGAALLSGLQPGANVRLVDAQGGVQAEFTIPRP